MLRIAYRFCLVLQTLFLCMVAGGISSALAAQEIVLLADQSQIVKLPQTPATLIIGNPAIADVTMDGKTLLFHPRGYGLTNVVALDAKGAKLGDYLVRVIYEDSYSVSTYTPGGRQTFACRRDCEPTMRIGDENTFFENYSSQAQSKTSLAANQAMGEDVLTPATTGLITTTVGAASP